VAHGDRRAAEAEKFGLSPALEPEGCKTLKEALAKALGRDRPTAVAA
jgi:hypothetical protein